MLTDAAPRRVVELESTGVTGLRLHTRGPVTLPWLSKWVVPVARELEGNGRLVYLRRGWLHGPHVDIIARRAFGSAPNWCELAAKLDAGPLDPGTALTQDEYLAQAEELGRLEGVPEPYQPMREHGVVEFLSAQDLSGPDSMLHQLRDVVAAVIAKPVLHTVDELADSPALATVRMAEAFVALADTHALGAAYGALSLRWHAEAFLSWAKPSRKVRLTFENRLAKEADQIRTVVAERLAGTPSPAAAAWRTAFGYCSGALDNAAATGFLTTTAIDTGAIDTGAIDTGGIDTGAIDTGAFEEGSRPRNDFQDAIDRSGIADAQSPFFAAYSLLTNLFYQQLPLLTVSSLHRYYMCYAIAETVDDLLGESWEDRLRARQWSLTAFAH